MTYLLALSLLANAGIVALFLSRQAKESDAQAKERNLLACRIQTPELVPSPFVDGSEDLPAVGFDDDEGHWEALKEVNGGS